MGDSTGDSIVTPYTTNLSGKDSNRCQMTRMFFRPDMFLGYGMVHAWVGQKLLNCFIFSVLLVKLLKKILSVIAS